MNPAVISTVVLAVLALMAALGTAVRWFYTRGRDEQKLANSVDRLTETGNLQATATNELAAQVSGLRVTLESHGEQLVEHHWRLRALEDRAPMKVTVEAP